MRKSWLDSTRGALLLLGASACVVAALWVLVFTTFPDNITAAVLHYSVGVGVDFIGEGGQVIMLPIAGTVLLVLNALFAYILRNVNVAASWILLSSSLIVQFIFLAAYL